MTPVLLKSIAAIAAVAGLAATSAEDLIKGPYDDGAIAKLTQAELSAHAQRVFARADIDGDEALSSDEYAALSIVTAELAHLNGFIVIEKEDGVATAPLPGSMHAALTNFEQARIEAVSRNAFYAFAGEDGRMSAGEFAAAQGAMFEAADFNHNGTLARQELGVFAQRQAHMSIEA